MFQQKPNHQLYCYQQFEEEPNLKILPESRPKRGVPPSFSKVPFLTLISEVFTIFAFFSREFKAHDLTA